MLKNKKGDASSIITFLIIVFFLAISFIVVVFANNEISEMISTTDLNSTDVATAVTDQLDTITETTVQRTFVFILAMLVIGMLISSFMVRVHPIFIFLYIFVLGVAIFSAVPLANAYEMVMNSENLTAIASQQTMMNWVMEHLVTIILGVGALSMIVLFAKLRSGGTTAGGASDF